MASGKVEKAKELWNIWDIRVLILLSLFIQVFLTFLAPLRKRNASDILKWILWALYLSASGIALYVISQISGGPNDSMHKIDLLAFWAPFLLLHLGGPDTITALALEDNELWHRHALELVTQVGVTLYVFSNSVHRRKSQLWVPTVLMFTDGCIKYFERTRALYFASIDSFRESLETGPVPGLNFARMMEAYHCSSSANIPTDIQGKDDPSSEVSYNRFTNPITDGGNYHISTFGRPYTSYTDDCSTIEGVNNDILTEDTDKMVIEAYIFFNKFKTIIADNLLDLRVLKESRDCFLKMTGPEALRIIEIELNLMYDVFYTKAFLLHSKQAYLRVVSYLAAIASLVWFSLLEKSNYNEVDVIITYILLSGAIALDMCAGVMLVLSDWYIIVNCRDFRFKGWKLWQATLLKLLHRMGWRRRGNRWSRSFSKYNLLKSCLRDPPSFFQSFRLRTIKEGLTDMLYVTTSNYTEVSEIVNFIVEMFKAKALKARDGFKGDVCSARGNLLWEDDYYLVSDYLQPWTTDVDYDESLLTWHLATDICYYTSITNNKSVDQDISKQLSDYMAYLFLKQKVLVSTLVSMSEKRFADTCAEAEKFMANNRRIDSWGTTIFIKLRNFIHAMLRRIIKCQYWSPDDAEAQEINEREVIGKFCADLLKVKGIYPPIEAKGDNSRSVLFEACRLAKQLKMLGEETQWEVISKVWLELVSYAAVRCSARSHVAQLNKGGELLTFVWLIMAHFGFGRCFSQVWGYSHTKLVVHK